MWWCMHACMPQALGRALSGVKLNGSLDERLQRSICELPTLRAQLLAKAQYLHFKPPGLQVRV